MKQDWKNQSQKTVQAWKFFKKWHEETITVRIFLNFMKDLEKSKWLWKFSQIFKIIPKDSKNAKRLENIPIDSKKFQKIQKNSKRFRKIPKESEKFQKIWKHIKSFKKNYKDFLRNLNICKVLFWNYFEKVHIVLNVFGNISKRLRKFWNDL